MFSFAMPVWLQFLIAISVAFGSIWWTRHINRGKPTKIVPNGTYFVKAIFNNQEMDENSFKRFFILSSTHYSETTPIYLDVTKMDVEFSIKSGQLVEVAGNEIKFAALPKDHLKPTGETYG